MRRVLFLFLVVVSLVAFPGQASANAGTPLMWAGMFHLVIGNLLIGICEGLLLAWLSGISKLKAIGAMVVANYLSAWLGGVFISGAIVERLPLDLNNGWKWFWIMVGVTYCLTLALEWPCIAWAFRGAQHWVKRSLRASLAIQSASYLVLFGWYWSVSGTSLYTRMHIVAPAELSLPESVLVYFIDPVDGDVYRRPLTKGGAEKIHDLSSVHRNDRLFPRPSLQEADRWDIVARLEGSDYDNPQLVPVLENKSIEVAPERQSTQADPPRYGDTWFSFGEVACLGNAKSGKWDFWVGFWAIEGMRATHRMTGEKVHFSYETPFGAWEVRNAVHLPSDKVLFQLGKDQICAFDPAKRQVALLWRGRGPVALLPKESSADIPNTPPLSSR